MPQKTKTLCNKNLQGTPSKGAQKTENRHFRLCEMPPLANEKRVHLREPLLSPDLEGPRRATNLGDLRPPEQRSQAALRGSRGRMPKVDFRVSKAQQCKKTGKTSIIIKIRKRCILHQLHIISSPYCSHVSYRSTSYPYRIHFHSTRNKKQHDSLLKRSHDFAAFPKTTNHKTPWPWWNNSTARRLRILGSTHVLHVLDA